MRRAAGRWAKDGDRRVEVATDLVPAVALASIVLRTVTTSARSASLRRASTPSGTSARAVGVAPCGSVGEGEREGEGEEAAAAGCGAGCGAC
jgi:hypothetical protein